ncbi:putative Auxin response factor [Hibiscus syriacus]|uniref:Auxin response factor n=1 Tax=Hibiscus syriacus TaxID=106335 RepID=A0A6A3A9F4_HIBSY|nr:putative Auxin response factor [Hibiscus syriacus]
MTPVASQEPSRTATPVGETTPLRSPTYSIPSTPRRGAPTSTSLNRNIDDESQHCPENGRKALSEKETNLKTRRQIVALGVQLGKMNIASWESKDEKEDITSSGDTTSMEELERIEYEKRAAAWEEAEKYKREEIKIQAWESRQRAKLEAEMRRIKEKVDPMRIQAQAKMVKKIAMATQDQKKSEQQLKLERIEMQKEQLLKQNTFEKPEECHCLLTCVVVGCHNNRVDNQ